MLLGCALNFVATLGFAYVRNYYLLIIARVIQSLSSSLTIVGGKICM